MMDKRKHPRKPPKTVFENNVLYQTIKEQPVVTGHGTLVDLSEGGCRVSGHTLLRKGVQIQLALHGEGGQLSTILSNCEVVWVNENEFGVKFLWDLQAAAKDR
jgi:PilZ domain